MSLAISSRASAPSFPLLHMLQALVLAGGCAILAVRLPLADTLPLWLDESWTAMIVTREDWGSFWREAWLDCNAPLYYLLMSLWVPVAGESNLLLRLPSFLFVLAAAAAPLLWRPRGLNRAGLWTWAALILFWGPGAFVMLDARAYGLLLLLSTLSCLAFARVCERLDTRRAALWVGLCTLMFLTHYFAAMLIVGQCLILLHRHRLRLLAVWPAALPALPGLAWFAWHLPRLRDYARPDVAWYEPTTLSSAGDHLVFVLGGETAAFVPLVALALLVGFLLRRGEAAPAVSAEQPGSLAAAALAGVIGILLALALGLIQPSLTDRYFVPMVPPVMLGLALLAQRSARQLPVSLLLVAVFLMQGLGVDRLQGSAERRYLYGFQNGSAFLAAHRPTHLVFSWDHPASKILDPGSLADLGGYFLKRDGLDVATSAVILRESDDPNRVLARVEGERPAIIWLYNTARASAARRHPPMLQRHPDWTCNHYRRPSMRVRELGTVACIKTDKRS